MKIKVEDNHSSFHLQIYGSACIYCVGAIFFLQISFVESTIKILTHHLECIPLSD